MDEIQKELIKAGNKDLAQEYFEKSAMGVNLKYAKDLIDKLIDAVKKDEEQRHTGKNPTTSWNNKKIKYRKDLITFLERQEDLRAEAAKLYAQKFKEIKELKNKG